MKKIIKQRMCVGCRTVKNKYELIRIVKNIDGRMQIDVSGKQNGRSAYLCKDIECLNKAAKKRQFDRSFKTKAGNDIYDEIRQYLIEMGVVNNK